MYCLRVSLSHKKALSPSFFIHIKWVVALRQISHFQHPPKTPQNIVMPRLSTWRITIILHLSFCASICLQPLFLRPFQFCICGRPHCPLNELVKLQILHFSSWCNFIVFIILIEDGRKDPMWWSQTFNINVLSLSLGFPFTFITLFLNY